MNQLLEKVRRKPFLSHDESLIAICGAGTLGGNLAQTLAQHGFRQLRIIDRDWVEEKTLADEPYTPRDIGTPKARTLTRVLYDLAEVEAEAQVIELTSDNAVTLLTGSDLVVDALANSAGRSVVAEACAALDVSCLHLVLDPRGSHGVLVWDDGLLPEALVDRIADAACEAIVRFFLTGEKGAA